MRSDTEVLQELIDANALGTVRLEVPSCELKQYHNLIIELNPITTTTLDEYLRIIKRG